YINPSNTLPFLPEAGDTVQIIESAYHDSRLPEFMLGYANGEVIRHSGVNHDGSGYYVDVIERGAEGTVQANQSGGTFDYYPALGPDTKVLSIPLEEFDVGDDGRLRYAGSVALQLPASIGWAAISCCFVRAAAAGEN